MWNIGVSVLPIMAVLFILIEIFLTNELAGLGKRVRLVEEQTDEVMQNNAILEQRIASASSLLVIEQKANEHGFMNAGAQYLSISPLELPLASRQIR